MNSKGFYAIWLVGVLFVQTLLMWLSGDVYINAHEGDVLHSLQGAIRVQEFERTHLDFATPLGVLSFAPVALLLSLGFGHGAAMAYSGVLVGAVFLPAIYWVGITRLNGHTRMIWAAVILLIFTASIFGDRIGNNSYSMYYNRWCWSASFVLLTALVLPNIKGRAPRLDGVIVGLVLGSLAITKITFFVALAPVVFFAYALQRNWSALLSTAFSGALVFVTVTVWAGGLDYWFAYIDDLKMASNASYTIRSGGWGKYISDPSISFSLLIQLAGAVILSRSGATYASLMVLVLTPVFLVITYYNWGFEPKFLLFLALVFWVTPEIKGRTSLVLTTLLVGVMAPMLLNITLSNFRQLTFRKEQFHPVFTTDDSGELLFSNIRSFERQISIKTELPDVFISYPDGFVLQLGNCTTPTGVWGRSVEIMDELRALGLENGSKILVADIFTYYWMFGDFGRLNGAAIWNYGSSHGLDTAEYILVPECAGNLKVRNSIMQKVADAGLRLDLVNKSDISAVYRLIR